MGKWIAGILTGILITVIGGYILLQMEYGWFARPAEPEPAAPIASPVATVDPPAVTEPTTPVEVEQASEIADETVSAPPPALDDRTITEARIEVKGNKISPTVYRASGPPGYIAHVFTAAGEIEDDAGCYVHWELLNNGVLLTTGDTSCNVSGGWSTAWWPNGTRLESGEVKVIGTITTEWGAATTTEAVFTVQRD